MLGLDAPEETLRRAFEDVAGVELCRGFAVGRSIFNRRPARWFNGTCPTRQRSRTSRSAIAIALIVQLAGQRATEAWAAETTFASR